MTPAEQARADVEACRKHCPVRGSHIDADALVARLVPVYKLAAVAAKLDEPICTLREYKAMRDRAERAEEQLKDARARHAQEKTARKDCERQIREHGEWCHALERREKADVARLRRRLRDALNAGCIHVWEDEADTDALAATERKP